MASFTVFKRQVISPPQSLFYDTTQHLPLNFDTTQDAVSAVPTFVVKGRRYVVLAYAEVQRRLLIRQ